MNITSAIEQEPWDNFLRTQRFRPFLQSWTMGEVYRDIGQEPVRIQAMDNGKIIAICYGHIVPAKRGRHIAVPYGPIVDSSLSEAEVSTVIAALLNELRVIAKQCSCAFIRMSPFTPDSEFPYGARKQTLSSFGFVPSPLHLLAEHMWYIPLRSNDIWSMHGDTPSLQARSEDDIQKEMRKTTRNLIRRAEKDGVVIEASSSPEADLESHFIRLHDETRKRHKFTPYTNAFFRAQVKHFSLKGECTVYLAKHAGEVIAASVHMHAFGETSYHHGSSSSAHNKIPSSYLLQWRAIQDAMKRGDHIYSFWGIAPRSDERIVIREEKNTVGENNSKLKTHSSKHPFSGVTLFKTGFGGSLLNLVHCQDVPVSKAYWLTYGFELIRKWRRGF